MPEIPDWMRIWYRKPQWQDVQDYTRQLNDEDIKPSWSRPVSPMQGSRQSTSIPSRLGLDRVLENKTCSPMSLHDFHLYLQHIEHSSENLEFFLWFKNYEASFPRSMRDEAAGVAADANLPPSLDYAGARSETRTPDASSVSATVAAKDSISSLTESIMKVEPPCARLASPETRWTDIFFRWSPAKPACNPKQQLIDSDPSCVRWGTCPIDSNEAEKGPAVPLPLPITTRPSSSRATQAELRAELDAAIARFLMPGAEKELNVSHSLRQRTLNNLQVSADPRHLRPVADHIYEVMRNCSHRNFMALGVVTGTYETICVGGMIGVLSVLCGFLLVLLRALYPHIGAHSRWEVFYSFPLWGLGATLLCVSSQGMCFILLSLAKRQALPWEMFEHEDRDQMRVSTASGPKRWWRRYRAFMNRTMAHGRNFKVEDKNLRRLQRIILFQCLSAGTVTACLGVLLFVFLPVWKETV